MILPPDWAPGLHPLVIHFPVALLVVAGVLDVASLLVRSRPLIARVATITYAVGAAASGVAYVTGRSAADSPLLDPSLSHYVSNHADWAFLTTLFFGIYGLARVSVGLIGSRRAWRWPDHAITRIAFAVVGVAGLSLLVHAGELGARLVFEHGAGVRALESVRAELEETSARLRQMARLVAGEEFARNDDGSWEWYPGSGAGIVVEEEMEVLLGDVPRIRRSTGPLGGVLMALAEPTLFKVPGAMDLVAVEAAIDLSGFDGAVRLIHHGLGPDSYDFLELDDGRLILGRMRSGIRSEFGSAPFNDGAAVRLSVMGDGAHFRGYIDGVLRVHGHGSQQEPGWTGFYVSGEGSIGISALSAEPVG